MNREHTYDIPTTKQKQQSKIPQFQQSRQVFDTFWVNSKEQKKGITFKTVEQLQEAENDIQELIDRKYNGAFYSVSAGEI